VNHIDSNIAAMILDAATIVRVDIVKHYNWVYFMNVWMPISPLSLHCFPLLSFNVYYIVQTPWAYLWDESTCNLHRNFLSS